MFVKKHIHTVDGLICGEGLISWGGGGGLITEIKFLLADTWAYIQGSL